MEQAETFYHELKQLRVAQGISLEDISARTRINIRFLEGLERGEFEILPKTYIRLFLRSYCKVIGANETEALEQLEEHLGVSDDYAIALPKDPAATALRPPKRETALETGTRDPARLRRDLLAGVGIFLLLIIVTFFARRVYQEPAADEFSSTVSTPDRTETPPDRTTPQPQLSEPPANAPITRPIEEVRRPETTPPPARRTQPVILPESAVELPDEMFTQERIVAHHMERVSLTPPVRLNLRASDNVVIQPVIDGQRGPAFNLTVAEVRFWTVQEDLVIRTTAIELLRADLNGVPINLGQASGIGVLRVTPLGEYEVFAYTDSSR